MADDEKTEFLLAGAAQIDVTPPPGKLLAAGFAEQRAEHVHDPLFIRALWLENNAQRILILNYDLAAVEAAVTDPVRKTLAAAMDMPELNIAVCATHTHTAPSIYPSLPSGVDEEYVQLLIERSIEVAKTAAAGRFEASVHYEKTKVSGYAENRLYRKSDGQETKSKTAPGVIGKAGALDEELQIMAIRDKTKTLRAMTINFACHCDSVSTRDGIDGRFSYSADWPGEMSKVLRNVYGDELVCLFLQGCAGDINPVFNAHSYFGIAQSSLKAAQIGRGIAGAAIYALEKANPEDHLNLRMQSARIEIPYYTRDNKLRIHIEQLRNKKNPTPFEKYYIERFDNWMLDGKTANVLIQILRIGEIALVFLPGEIFSGIGLEIKHYSPIPKIMICELSDRRNVAYVPGTDQARRGAYGSMPVMSRWTCDDAGRLMAEKVIEMLYIADVLKP